MAMTPRERLLALGVGATVGLFGVQYAISSVRGSLLQKQINAEAAQADYEEANMIEASGLIAGEKLNRLKARSLPAKVETLRAQYRDWLFQLGEEAGLNNVKVTPPTQSPQRTDAYTGYTFTLSGNCSTDEVIELLGRYYDKDYLHTITLLKLEPSAKDSSVITVTLESQVLALQGVGNQQEPSTASSGRLAMSIEEYQDAILSRNPFSPPNQPPQIATGRSQEIELGKNWEIALEAKDPENHAVKFELVSKELPKGLNFRGNTLSWKPETTGEHVVRVRAIDGGWPSRSSEQELTLRVVEPPREQPKKPPFNVASQAFVTSMVSGRRGPQASIRSRTEGKTVELVEGGDIEVGEIKAKVMNINLNEEFIELETDGTRWMLDWGTSVAEAYSKSQID